MSEQQGEVKRKVAAVVLAAGMGTRMKSRQPKVLHRVGGRPMILHVADAIQEAGADEMFVVVGHAAERVEDVVGERGTCVLQGEQLGTGHAVMSAAPRLRGFEGDVLICCGDTPLLRAETLAAMIRRRRGQGDGASGVVLTTELENPFGYGRVARGRDGMALRIIEQKDLAEHEQGIREINAGVYCVDAKSLFGALDRVGKGNAQGEYYLTDIVEILGRDGRPIEPFATDDPEEIMGVNSRRQLAEAEFALRRRTLERLMDEGVTIIDPDTTFVDARVKVGRDAVLRPFTMLEGDARVGEEAVIGPNARVVSSEIGAGARVWESTVQSSAVGDGASVGPYVYLHAGCEVAPGVSVGGFLDIAGERIKRDGAHDNESRSPRALFAPRSARGSDLDDGAHDQLREEKMLDAPSGLASAGSESAPRAGGSVFPSGWKPKVPIPDHIARQQAEFAVLREAKRKRKEAEAKAREEAAKRQAAQGAAPLPARANIGREKPPAPSLTAPPPAPSAAVRADDPGDGIASPRERAQAARVSQGRVVKVSDPDNPDLLLIERACDLLLSGGLVAFPTDTVYGLACDATNRKALARMREAKKRDADKPFVAMVHNERMLRMMLREIPAAGEALIEKFWPGALTLIFKRPKAVLEDLGHDETIGVRMPNHYLATAIISMVERPLAVTSVNLSGMPPLNSAAEIEKELGEAVDLIIDAPAKLNVPPSTVLRVAGGEPVILREGAIGAKEISEALGREIAPPSP